MSLDDFFADFFFGDGFFFGADFLFDFDFFFEADFFLDFDFFFEADFFLGETDFFLDLGETDLNFLFEHLTITSLA